MISNVKPNTLSTHLEIFKSPQHYAANPKLVLWQWAVAFFCYVTACHFSTSGAWLSFIYADSIKKATLWSFYQLCAMHAQSLHFQTRC